MSKKKADREIKRLKKRVKETTADNALLEKRVRKLEKKLGDRKQRITALEVRLSQPTAGLEVSELATLEISDGEGGSFASSLRSAWKQHSYLRDRYEFHLAAGLTKGRARHLANEDLKGEYGPVSGYTEEELEAILS